MAPTGLLRWMPVEGRETPLSRAGRAERPDVDVAAARPEGLDREEGVGEPAGLGLEAAAFTAV